MISAVNVTTTAAIVVAARHARKLLIIQNVSDTDIYLKLDSSATALTTANGMKLAAGASPFVLTCNPGEFVNAIYAIHGGTGSKEIRVQEEPNG